MAESMIASGKRDREDLGLASTEALDHEPGAQRLRVAEEFGEEYLTNAAGEQLPDSGDAGDPAAAAAPVGLSEEYPSEAREALDDAGLEERQPGEETADELAAAEAADAAHRVVTAEAGGGAAADEEQIAIIDALAAAEDAYDAAHPEAAPDAGQRHLRDEVSGASSPAGVAAAQTSAAVTAPGRAGGAGFAPREEISSSGREGACRRLAAALAGSPAFAASGGDAAVAASELEGGIHEAVTTRAGYRAVLANAVRLAATTADTRELLRTVLSGPQPSPQQVREQERTLPVESSGLQGYVMKPRYS